MKNNFIEFAKDLLRRILQCSIFVCFFGSLLYVIGIKFKIAYLIIIWAMGGILWLAIGENILIGFARKIQNSVTDFSEYQRLDEIIKEFEEENKNEK